MKIEKLNLSKVILQYHLNNNKIELKNLLL